MTDRAEALAATAADASGCRACPLWAPATQTVFGEGPVDAPLVLVGEQPGDQEDLAGRPFVGPAGRVLDQALADAGVDRRGAYLTNAVKHFKYETRGTRRIHQKPNTTEIVACHRWIDAELELVGPRVVVALGAVALRSLLGRAATVTATRGRPHPFGDAQLVATLHPSAILRASDAREAMRADLVADLRLAASLLG